MNMFFATINFFLENSMKKFKFKLNKLATQYNAVMVKDLSNSSKKYQIIGIYHVFPSIDENEFVVLSSVDLYEKMKQAVAEFRDIGLDDSMIRSLFGTETYIFPSDGNEMISLCEIEGSQKNTMSHKKIFADLGYTVENPLC